MWDGWALVLRHCSNPAPHSPQRFALEPVVLIAGETVVNMSCRGKHSALNMGKVLALWLAEDRVVWLSDCKVIVRYVPVSLHAVGIPSFQGWDNTEFLDWGAVQWPGWRLFSPAALPSLSEALPRVGLSSVSWCLGQTSC